MIAEVLKGVTKPGNTPVNDMARMTEGQPEHSKSPAEGPGF
jgi:hypothetical protein